MLLVGLTGSLTTMSALSIESVEMLSGGSYSQALLNILLNVRAVTSGSKLRCYARKIWI